MAGILLKMTGKHRNGEKAAREILESGKAWKKMEQIIKLQGKQKMPELGEFTYTVRCGKTGCIKEIDNDTIAKIARIAGAPHDKGAGLYLYKKFHQPVKKGEKLYTIYAENQFKLDLATKFARKENGYFIQ
jgi:thymidine phosphorylase